MAPWADLSDGLPREARVELLRPTWPFLPTLPHLSLVFFIAAQGYIELADIVVGVSMIMHDNFGDCPPQGVSGALLPGMFSMRFAECALSLEWTGFYSGGRALLFGILNCIPP